MKLLSTILDGAAMLGILLAMGAVLTGMLITRSVMWAIGRGWNFEERTRA